MKLSTELASHRLREEIITQGKSNSVWVIGDVHGCSIELKKLCELILASNSDEFNDIIQVGDLIDRGPDLYEVIKVCKDYNIISILGNHEINFILERMGLKRCGSKARIKTHDNFDLLDNEKQNEIMNYLLSMPNYVVVEGLISGEIETMLCHSIPKISSFYNTAGVNGWTYCSRNTQLDINNYEQGFILSYGIFNIVHGHQHWNYSDIEEQILNNKNKELKVFNVDSGCVYGKELIAFNISNKKDVIRVKSSFKFEED